MATLLQKFRTVVLGDAHALLDKIIDLNSIPAIKQHIRDLEEAVKNVESEAAVAEGSMVHSQEKLTAVSAQIKELNKNIDFILSDGDDKNDHLAEPLQARLIGLEEQEKSLRTEMDNYKQTMEATDQVVSALKAKLMTELTRITLLESQDKSSKARTRAADAIQMASELLDGPSVDNIADQIGRKASISDAKLKRAMGNMEAGVGQDVLLARAKARLVERKAALKAGEQK